MAGPTLARRTARKRLGIYGISPTGFTVATVDGSITRGIVKYFFMLALVENFAGYYGLGDASDHGLSRPLVIWYACDEGNPRAKPFAAKFPRPHTCN